MILMVTGGVRSGKSSFAERYVQTNFTSATYIATAVAFDQEMKERISMHTRLREQSGFDWQTIEEPFELTAVLADLKNQEKVIVVDCLTVWLSNWLMKLDDEQRLDELSIKIDELIQTLQHVTQTIIFVTNEVGYGIVPEYRLGRIFRDFAGILNQRLAERCDDVFLVVAGIPLNLKQHRFEWNKDEKNGRNL